MSTRRTTIPVHQSVPGDGEENPFHPTSLIAPTERAAAFPAPIPASQLVAEFPEMKPVIIDGVLRVTETLNIVAAPKSHKTYLAMALGLSIAIGRDWLGRAVTAGRVLYIDYELHSQTFAKRLAVVSSAMGIRPNDLEDRLTVLSLRGRLIDIVALGAFVRSIPKGEYAVIVLDALYRTFPKGFDENSNADMTVIYNVIDQYAESTGAAFVIVHHASKGNQSAKAVTDVGSGAGAQSRAADSHLVFRPHEENDCIVLDGAVRSFPPIRPTCLRWVYPTWSVDTSLDPARLKQPERRQRREQKPEKPAQPAATTLTTDSFVSTFITDHPHDRATIIAKAWQAGVLNRQAERFIRLALAEGLVWRWAMPKTNAVYLATKEQPLTALAGEP